MATAHPHLALLGPCPPEDGLPVVADPERHERVAAARIVAALQPSAQRSHRASGMKSRHKQASNWIITLIRPNWDWKWDRAGGPEGIVPRATLTWESPRRDRRRPSPQRPSRRPPSAGSVCKVTASIQPRAEVINTFYCGIVKPPDKRTALDTMSPSKR